jgi:SAM-dependent methyltransferase
MQQQIERDVVATVESTGGTEERYNYFRLPFIRALLRMVYAIEMLTVLRVWHVRRTLDDLLGSFGRNFSVLDMGCGLADYLFLYASSYPQARFVGVDNVEDNILVCRAYQRLLKLENVAFLHADLGAVQTAAAQDVVLCITALQYVDQLGLAFRNIHDNMVVGGVLVLYQDVYRSRDEESATRRASYGVRPESVRKYTAAEILTEVANAGFSVDSIRYCQGFFARHAEAMFRGALNTARWSSWVGAVAVGIALGLFPIYLLVLWLDFVTTHKSGGGLLVVARRTPAASRSGPSST